MSTRPISRSDPASFLGALSVQSRVIGALILRELHTRYGRENIGYLWMLGEPMLLASVIGAMHLSAGHTAYGPDVNPLTFGLLGYTVFILFRGIVNRAEGALGANAPLLYHRQVTILDVTVSRALLEFASTFTTSVILMSLAIVVGMGNAPVRPLALIAAWFLMFWYALGHSLIISAISHDNHLVGRLVHPYSYFMVGLSGAFTPLGWLPHPFREWLTYIPMTSIFELARYGEFRSFNLDYFYPMYLISSCVIMTWIGLVQLRIVRHRIHLS